jgi:nitrate reductase beta subunit
MYNPQTRISEKCIACYPRVEQDTVTRCIAACVGKIRLQGWINLPEKIEADNPMDYLVHVAKVALPSYPQFGTEPNVFYIPPRWVPRGYLKQLFGPGVENAIKRYSDPDPDLLGLLQLFGTTQQIIEKFRVTEKDAIGYDAHKREIIRVPLEDPIVIRPPIYHNIT